MPNGIRCENCIERCPQAEMANEIAKGRMYATNEFIAMQKKVESGQLVEVVRCKDCKHWKHFDHLGCTDFAKVCGLANYMVGATGYCVYGERRCE